MDSPTSAWISVISNEAAYRAVLICSLLFAIIIVAGRAFPTRLTATLDHEIQLTNKLYYGVVGAHLLDFRQQLDAGISKQFLVYAALSRWTLGLTSRRLDDEARKLRIETLGLSTHPFRRWCGECFALINGHSFAIWKCTWRTRTLNNRIKVRSRTVTVFLTLT